MLKVLILCLFSTILMAEPKYPTGLVKPQNAEDGNYVSPKKEGFMTSIFGLPSSFDLRAAGGLPPVRNQGQCGSCWAFAISSAIDDLMWLKYKNKIDYHYAEQTLVSNCYSGGDCNGGYFTALNYTRDRGLHSSVDDPYLGANSQCKHVPFRVHTSSWSYLGYRGRSPTVAEIKNALFTHGPVIVDIFANDAFMAYSGGVFDKCEKGATNHMLLIEGYSDVDGAWIVRNSWGTLWGEGGYARIKYNCNSIASMAAVVSL